MRLRLLPLLLSVSPILGAAPPPHCATLAEPTARLACYDALWPPAGVKPAAADFGFTREQARVRKGTEGPPDPKEVRATVVDVRQRPTGEFVATMEGGEVWAQAELNSKARLHPGSVVTIRRGALGSYLLVTPDGIGTRVRRIE